MAKRNKADAKPAVNTTPLAHNPFAALLPPVVAEVAETTQAREAAPKGAAKPAPKNAAPSEAAPKKPKSAKAAKVDPDAAKNWGTKLVLSREKKGRGGKTVTRITGLPKARLELVAKSMKKSLGCGASVDGDDVLLHGMLTERGAAWLTGQGAKRVIIGN